VDPSAPEFPLELARFRLINDELIVVPDFNVARQVLVIGGMSTDDADELVRRARERDLVPA
jgi:hypothetical protein